jgi:hypothetical protein
MIYIRVQLTFCSRCGFFLDFSILLFIFVFNSLLLLYKYLFELVRETISLFVLEQVLHTFSVTNIKNNFFQSALKKDCL